MLEGETFLCRLLWMGRGKQVLPGTREVSITAWRAGDGSPGDSLT
jgi:hypothetical protein